MSVNRSTAIRHLVEMAEIVVDVPPDELPWLALHPTVEWIGHQLRLDKRPLHWFHRPVPWPARNHEHRRLVRFWTASDGLDHAVIAALRSRELSGLAIVEPGSGELIDQFRDELVVSRRHLSAILDHYWDRE